MRANKLNQDRPIKDIKKYPRINKTIDSFFRPISTNRNARPSYLINNNKVSEEKNDLPSSAAVYVYGEELRDVVTPSPQSTRCGKHLSFEDSSTIFTKSRRLHELENKKNYKRLKFKKTVQKCVLSSQDTTCIPTDCDDNYGLIKEEPTKKVRYASYGEEKGNDQLDSITCSYDGTNACIAQKAPISLALKYDVGCSWPPPMNHKQRFQSKIHHIAGSAHVSPPCDSINKKSSIGGKSVEFPSLPTHITLLKDGLTVLKRNSYDSSTYGFLNDSAENIVDISDINFDDDVFGSEFVISTDCNDNQEICSSDIETGDCFLDSDLDEIFNCSEEDTGILLSWKVIAVTESYIHSDGAGMEKILELKSEDYSTNAICYLRGDWYLMKVDVEDMVYVSGLSKFKKSCILDNMSTNYIVTFPNTLISGTTIATGITCERQAVLKEYFKTDLHSNTAVFLGSLTHDLFDWLLQHNNCTHNDIEMRAWSNLKSAKYLEQLNILNLDIPGIINLQQKYYMPMWNWSRQFMSDGNGTEIDFKIGQENGEDIVTIIHVDNIIDIEESIWSPCYGLKGKIDATVEVTIHRMPKLSNIASKRKCKLPLEFKTGKMLTGLGSIDHRAQVAVYTMLMSEKYKVPVESGLLLYGLTGHMIGVPRPEQEKRAILIKRNEIARYLSLEKKKIALPPLIKENRTCTRCDQNETCMLYFKSLECGDTSNSGVGELFTQLTSHLSLGDLDYFAKWYKLIMLEAYFENNSCRDKYIWKKSAEQREKDGICFSGMLIVSSVQAEHDCTWVYKFKRKKTHFNSACTLKTVPLGVGVRVIISKENVNVFNITTGYITDVSFDVLTVSVNHEIRSMSKMRCDTYRIDKDDSLSNCSALLKNLSQMFKCNSVIDAKLRKLIIRNDRPGFSDEKDNFCLNKLSNISALNDAQKAAITKCLTANDYVVIHGMPGAGKSTTVVSIVLALVSIGKSVLLSSYTHSAVDTILIKLIRAGFTNFVRVGQLSRLHPKVLPYSYYERTKLFTDVCHYEAFYNEQSVVATTCLGINHPIFVTKQFDYCIVDEASQITQPVCIGPIRKANVFILVGDHNQLPPLVINPEAKEKGLDCSLLQYLSERHHDAVVTLSYQYRMNNSIMFLMNNLVYENQMKCANEKVANSVLHLPKYTELHAQMSSQICVIVDPKVPVLFVNTDGVGMEETKTGSFIVNRGEAALVKGIIESFIQCGLSCQDMGVISMYRHQVDIIREEIMGFGDTIEVDTMDKYQGRDKDCILVSFVRSNATFEVGELLKDWRRINVAMTRAKTKLIMIGSRTTIVSSEILSKLVDLVESQGWCIDLKE